jgi:hypothetical protein
VDVQVGEVYHNAVVGGDVRVVRRGRGLTRYAVEVRAPGAADWEPRAGAPTLQDAARQVESFLGDAVGPPLPR